MVSFLVILAVIAFQLLLLYRATGYLNRVAYERLGKRLYLAFMMPGVVVHECSHLVGCWLSRTRVHEVKLFSPKEEGRGRLVLGYVSHEIPGNPLAKGMIGAAPFFGGAAVLWAAFALAFPTGAPAFDVALPPSGGISDALTALGTAFAGYRSVLLAVVHADWHTVLPYVAMYVVISVAAHVAPSRDDLRYAIEGLAVAFTVLLAAFFILTGFNVVPAGAFVAAVAPKLAAVAALLGYGFAGIAFGVMLFFILRLLAVPFPDRRRRRGKR